jgi:thioredoxin-related protein
MKNILTAMLSVFAITLCSAQEKSGIQFEQYSNFREVMAKAKEKKKKIFVDVYTTWCGPCKQMDKEVYPDSALGALMNSTFISIKLQADSTVADNEYVQNWRADTRALVAAAKISGYPAYLFFNSDGKLIYKEIGFRDVSAFTRLAKFSADSARTLFQSDLLAYQNGIMNYGKMPGLAAAVRELLDDRKLSRAIAQEYKTNFLDKLPSESFLTEENIRFINDNGGPALVNVNDHFFKAAYNSPSFLDSMTMPGMSEHYVNSVISILVSKKLFRNTGEATVAEPNWNAIEHDVVRKYQKIDVAQFMLNEKVLFYARTQNYRKFSKYKTEQLAKYPPKTTGLDVLLAYNFPAWEMFLKSNDKVVLKQALDWVERGINLEPEKGSIIQYLDTKANLLYKLGRKQEAIAFEQYAIDFAKQEAKDSKREKPLMIDEFEETLMKMKKDLPTWE